MIFITTTINVSKCLRQTATHPCGRTHRLMSKNLEKVSPRGLKSTKLGPKVHQVGFQNPPSWAPKPRKISPGRSLEGSWGHLGPSWPPRPSQDPSKPEYLGKTPPWLPFGKVLGPKINLKGIQKVIFLMIVF